MIHSIKISVISILLIGFALCLSFCKKKPTLSVVTTSNVTDITETTATTGGNVTGDGGAKVTAKGVCWYTSANPTVSNSKTSDGTGTGSFTSSLAQLAPGTNYYVRAYATNSEGTSYGNQISFATGQIVVGTLTTTSITSITTTTAVSGGNVTSDGGSAITVRGVCWNTSSGPTISNSKTSDGAGSGTFISNITGLSLGTIYYIRAYATNSAGTAYGNEISFTTNSVVATISTSAITSITTTTAGSGGSISNDGGSPVTARGVCWNTTSGPSISNSKTSDGAGSGTFSSNLTGLSGGTTYYVRAYATNSAGTAYGNEINFITSSTGITVTDIDGNVYKTVTIGNQVWMAENLKTTKYNDNTTIPNVTDNTLWAALTTPAYCWYHNDAATYKANYGALYNWYVLDAASNGGKNACPIGWHVSTDAEWTTLTDYLTNNGYGFGGSGTQIAKSMADTSGWEIDGTAGNAGNDQASNNSSGFAALPGGYRSPVGVFYEFLVSGYWWNFTGPSTATVYRYIQYNSSYVKSDTQYEQNGLSVRCLKN